MIKPYIIDFKKTDFEENIKLFNENKNLNLFGFNLTDEQHKIVLERCQFVKYNEIGKTISLYNKAFIRKPYRIGIVCDNENNLKIMEELFEMLVVFGLKGRRVKLFKDINRKSDITTCDIVIDINTNFEYSNNMKVVKYDDLLGNIYEVNDYVNAINI